MCPRWLRVGSEKPIPFICFDKNNRRCTECSHRVAYTKMSDGNDYQDPNSRPL